jgi:histidinol-phosphate phosphatase family protein
MASRPGGKSVYSPKQKRRRAVFLDRDGTVNALRFNEYIVHPRMMRLLPGAAQAIRAMNRLGYLVIIVTNQGVIAREKATHKGLEEIHGKLIARLKKHGAKIDAFYYCPHHPDGTQKELGIVCKCRKPEIGMIQDAVKEFGIDPKRSFMVGDTTGDILVGKRAGLTTILVGTGYGGKDKKHDVKADHTARNLTEAARIIKKGPER